MKPPALIATIALVAALGFVAASAPASEGDRAALAQLQPNQREREPKYCPKGDEDGYDANELRGRKVPTARRIARAEGCELRVVKRDGKWRAVTDDFVPNRINVSVRDDRVKRVYGIH